MPSHPDYGRTVTFPEETTTKALDPNLRMSGTSDYYEGNLSLGFSIVWMARSGVLLELDGLGCNPQQMQPPPGILGWTARAIGFK